MTRKTLDTLLFDNSYSRLPSSLFTLTEPTPLPEPVLLSLNHQVAQKLGLDTDNLNTEQLSDWLAGQYQAPGSQPLAMKYTGHQFGDYNPELGDGRGLLLGEVINAQHERFDLHLKGAGKTPYSRFGDGRAVVRSSIREYLVGEALSGLGIPSTRALALIASPEPVRRETWEPAASLLRVSPCHIRFGHFEFCYRSGDKGLLKTLADYCIERLFPDCKDKDDPVASMFQQIVERSANMVAGWQAYGFLHGVMNTDNMSLIGETFDHGPFAFIDRWDAEAVYNHTDMNGLYAFGRQPGIIKWNLSVLAEALSPLTHPDALHEGLKGFRPQFQQASRHQIKQRLGLYEEQEGDTQLLESWLTLLAKEKVDFQRLYRNLAESIDDQGRLQRDTLGQWEAGFANWFDLYAERLENSPHPNRSEQMRQVNPVYVLRTHIAQAIIDQAHKGQFEMLNEWLLKLQSPFDGSIEDDPFLHAPNEVGHTQLSCSS